MSYRCHFCKKSPPPRTRMTRVVTGVRLRQYDLGNGRFAEGHEIDHEVAACPTCATRAPS